MEVTSRLPKSRNANQSQTSVSPNRAFLAQLKVRQWMKLINTYGPIYERSPTKQDSTGDFTWKDAAAAVHLGMSVKTYVIGGMDPDLRELLYHAGLAMDAAGIHWTILSAFRDDYRQSLASGLKAHTNNSLHGGSVSAPIP